MGGKGSGTTTQQAQIPPELQQLYRESSGRVLGNQRNLPLTDFTDSGEAFGTAPRAGQFGQAERAIGQSQTIAAGQPPSRAELNARPVGTQAGIRTASQAQQRTGQAVPVQALERGAINRANTIPRTVGFTPGTFQQTQGQFNQGIRPLRESASRVPSTFGQVPGTFGEVRREADPRIANLLARSDSRVTGAGIQESPAYQAAIDAFESAILPQVQNSAAQAGLGRTTGLQQSIAQAQAQYLLPVIQGELAREERGIDRGLGARQFGISTAAGLGLQEAQAQERGIQQGALAQERGIQRGTDIGQFGLATGANLGLAIGAAQERAAQRRGAADQFASQLQAGIGGLQAARLEQGFQRDLAGSQFLSAQQQAAGQQDLQRSLAGLGADERSRALQFQQSQAAIPQLTQLGQLEQDFSQAGFDRQTQDFLRRQALAEQALYQPFGLIAPSAIGQQSTSQGKK